MNTTRTSKGHTADLLREIELLIEKPKAGTSNRLRDQARTKLKRLGLIEFDRKAWSWVVLPAGRAALRKASEGDAS